MDRLALSKRLEGLSTVFAGDTRIHTDLKAMSYVLANMKDEDYKKILSSDYQADEFQEVEAFGEGQFMPGQARPKAERPSDVWKGRIPASGTVVRPEAIKNAIIQMAEQMTGEQIDPNESQIEEAVTALQPLILEKVQKKHGPMGLTAAAEGQFMPGQARPKATRPSDVWKGRAPASGKPVTEDAIKKAIIQMAEQMTGKPIEPDDKAEIQKAVTILQPVMKEKLEKAKQTPQMPGLQKYSNEEGDMSVEASDSAELGNYWNKEASHAVVNGLLRDVVGMDKTRILETNRKLTPNQTPDGKHEGVPEKPKTLKPDQTPDQADVLESDMYAQSNKTPLRKTAKKDQKSEKEAGSKKGPGVPDGTGPYGGTSECQMSEKSEGEKSAEEEDPLDKIMAKVNRGRELTTTERKALSAALDAAKKAKGEKSAGALEKMKEQKAKGKEQKAEKLEEQAKEHSEESAEKLEKAEKMEEEAEKAKKSKKEKKQEEKQDVESSEDPTTIVSEGIELTPSMDEVSLGDEEAQKLSKLFE